MLSLRITPLRIIRERLKMFSDKPKIGFSERRSIQIIAMYRCPVCKTQLSKRQYEKALGILDAREERSREQHSKKLAEERRKTQHARASGIQFERKRTTRLLTGQRKTIRRLEERVVQLQRGSTPQTEELEFEGRLFTRVKL